ncbi:hypothetical protein BRADI_2g58013v3 [Brachypodium distachyon]|uniref:Uncharacterized protein n=1 Tax=Brachypodium distachyon TaxID=15368 RepID=A0A2K2DGJ9_BRADI|nr:hypothetical protein BRADI_2g58013v3 [Brachypodium distachyon]
MEVRLSCQGADAEHCIWLPPPRTGHDRQRSGRSPICGPAPTNRRIRPPSAWPLPHLAVHRLFLQIHAARGGEMRRVTPWGWRVLGRKKEEVANAGVPPAARRR